MKKLLAHTVSIIRQTDGKYPILQMHLDAQQKNKPIDIKCDIYSYLRFWMGKSETNKEII